MPTSSPEPPPPIVPQRGAPWLLHLLVLVVVLGTLFVILVTGSSDRIGRALAIAFVFVPAGLSYSLVSTALVAAVHWGSGRRVHGWRCVALAHALGLIGAVGGASFMTRSG